MKSKRNHFSYSYCSRSANVPSASRSLDLEDDEPLEAPHDVLG